MRKILLVISFMLTGFIFFAFSENSKIQAGTCTWTGNSNSNWDNSSNWTAGCSGIGGIPGFNDNLIFPESASNKNNNNDIVSLTLNSILIEGDGYTLGGNAITINSQVEADTINTVTYIDFASITLSDSVDFIAESNLVFNSDTYLNGNILTFKSTGEAITTIGAIHGSGNIVVNGPYLTRFSGTNDFTGSITVDASGTFIADSNSALGNSSNIPQIMTGSYFGIEGGNTISNDLYFETATGLASYGSGNVIAGDIEVEPDGALSLFPTELDSLTINGKITAAILSVGSTSSSLTLGGSTSNDIGTLNIQASTIKLAKTGGAIAVPSNIIVSQGTDSASLVLNGSNQIGDDATITLNSMGLWDLNGYDETIGSLVLDAGNVETNNGDLTIESGITATDDGEIDTGTGTLDLSVGISIDSTDATSHITIKGSKLELSNRSITFANASNDFNFLEIEAPIYGSGTILATGAETILDADNSNFSGNITVGNSSFPNSLIGLNNANGLGNSVGTTTIYGGSTLVTLNEDITTVSEDITLNGNGLGEVMGVDFGALTNFYSTNINFSGDITLGSNSRIYNIDSNQLELGGVISGNYNLTLESDSNTAGSITLSSDNSYNGETTIKNTTVILDAESAIAWNKLTLEDEPNLILNESQTVGNIYGDGVIDFNDVWLTTLTFGSPVPTFSGEFTGTGVVYKYGAGEWILSGTNAGFTGPFYNAEGKITVNGAFTGGTFWLQGGSWGGNGTIGTTGIDSGAISPGSSPGTLSFTNSVGTNGYTDYYFELNGATAGTGYDKINITGDLNINNAKLNLSLGYNPSGNTKFTIIQTTGNITGTFENLPNYSPIVIDDTMMVLTYKAHSVELLVASELYLYNFSATPNPAITGQNLTLSATWGGSGPVPTGNSLFMEGGNVLGSVAMVNGNASLTIPNITAGTHLYTVAYTGDSVYNGAYSGQLEVKVYNATTTKQVETTALGNAIVPDSFPLSSNIEEEDQIAEISNDSYRDVSVAASDGNIEGESGSNLFINGFGFLLLIFLLIIGCLIWKSRFKQNN